MREDKRFCFAGFYNNLGKKRQKKTILSKFVYTEPESIERLSHYHKDNETGMKSNSDIKLPYTV